MIHVRIAAFNSDYNTNHIKDNKGLTLVEAVVRAVDESLDEEKVFDLVQTYGPDDFEELREYYFERGIFLSEPEVVDQEEK
ncbi:hypothetical protein [Cytobacillus sp. IB215665]|uniref:hypothetical protein n=1 Tax=Cytobacillus sp. IB215665 TaxID=3097357 RepID=UPI002A0F0C2B|nr:hypothetical protein [Cytobacillus sp. IB215665]MDX8367708.1 hypothetical protein [Cytobacillus sp. IB215665]